MARIEREQGLEIAERIRGLLESSPLYFEGNRIDMTVSIGMTLVREDEPFKLSVILSRADDSMYEAKNGSAHSTKPFSLIEINVKTPNAHIIAAKPILKALNAHNAGLPPPPELLDLI